MVVIYLFYLRVIFMHGGHQQCMAQVLFNVRLVAFCWASIWLSAPSDGHVPPGLILSWGDSHSVTDQSDRVKGPAASAQQSPMWEPSWGCCCTCSWVSSSACSPFLPSVWISQALFPSPALINVLQDTLLSQSLLPQSQPAVVSYQAEKSSLKMRCWSWISYHFLAVRSPSLTGEPLAWSDHLTVKTFPGDELRWCPSRRKGTSLCHLSGLWEMELGSYW